jgi:hypothetical protein
MRAWETTLLASLVGSAITSALVSWAVYRFRCRLGIHWPAPDQPPLWIRRDDNYPVGTARRCERCGRLVVTFDEEAART